MRKQPFCRWDNSLISKIKSGWYSDTYFLRSQEVLRKDGNRNRVLMQVFCKHRAVLAGTDEVKMLLQNCSLEPRTLKVEILKDGDEIKPWETAATIEGEYRSFAHLETLYLGIFARRTMVATSVREAVQVAKPKSVFFFAARFDHFLNQEGDGYAAFLGGAAGVSTDAGACYFGGKGVGTIPHALIATYQGDTVSTCAAFDRHMSRSYKRIALVDFDNNCVKTSLEVARALGKNLWGVRLDTAENIRDASIRKSGKKFFGVCPDLVWNVRKALDREGFTWVKIMLSGGFNAERIREFKRLRVPFDAVGIGSAFFSKRIDFTADVVKVNDKLCAKVGRQFRPNRRLKKAW